MLPAPGSHYLSFKRHPQHILEQEDEVEWAVQQQEIRRDKRDIFYYDYQETTADTQPDVPLNYRLPLVISLDRGSNEVNYKAVNGQRRRKHQKPLFNDELWDHEWYLVSHII